MLKLTPKETLLVNILSIYPFIFLYYAITLSIFVEYWALKALSSVKSISFKVTVKTQSAILLKK